MKKKYEAYIKKVNAMVKNREIHLSKNIMKKM